MQDWLSGLDLKFYESKINLNWKPILKSIMEVGGCGAADSVGVALCYLPTPRTVASVSCKKWWLMGNFLCRILRTSLPTAGGTSSTKRGVATRKTPRI